MVDQETVLSVDNLTVDFATARGLVRAVRGVSFTLKKGETLAILGESGSGKSVTASAVMNLIRPPGKVTGGAISYRDRDLLTMPMRERRALYGRKLAMVFQDPLAALNPLYTVGWQIAEAFRLHGAKRAASRAGALRLLERVGLPNPADCLKAYPHQLSGGQRQRVVIAIAIAMQPDILIADEPTSALDVTVQARILRLIKDLQSEMGTGLLLITHDIGVVAAVADRVAVMQHGTIVESGEVASVLRQPYHPYTQRLLDSIPGRGAALSNERPVEILASIEKVSKTYTLTAAFGRQAQRVVKALDDVSFEFHRGESLGIVGESGSGKSTLSRLLLKLEPASAGRITFEGADISAFSRRDTFAFRRRVQAVFQDPTASLNPYMTVEQIICEPWDVQGSALTGPQRSARVRELLTLVGLEPAHALRNPHQFSGGQRQRIAIARALALEPDVIVFDEAVSALDVSVQAQVLALLKQLKSSLGLSYIFIAHDLGIVRDFCDRVLVMYRGQIVESGPTGKVFDTPAHDYTRELLSASPMLAPQARAILASAAPKTIPGAPA